MHCPAEAGLFDADGAGFLLVTKEIPKDYFA